MPPTTPEHIRLQEARTGTAAWRRWGPYLAERAWGTVREDYSASGNAWDYFPHDHARSRAYRWSEDGIGGMCDEQQYICLAVALWNERDPIIKERMFGLAHDEGNHGEDVKEYYFFLDGTPTHSYMKMLYKYPQVAYPYADLVKVNAQRTAHDPEYELFDALQEAFLARRYFDVFIEWAKDGPEDLLCRITAVNRGTGPAPIQVLPHCWYRNVWSWQPGTARPAIEAIGPGAARTEHPQLGKRWWYARADGQPVELLFTENETNFQRLYGVSNPSPYVKDGINDALTGATRDRVNTQRGSKLAGRARAVVPPGAALTVRVRFSAQAHGDPFAGFDDIVAARAADADAFYAAVHPPRLSPDERLVQRQAFAGLLWSKQFYNYDVYRWLLGDPGQPVPPESRWRGRNRAWKHLNNADVILMPDTWEFPWYASWDLAFHCVAVAHIDPELAKHQLLRLGREWYQHADGQFPAYEWNFDDINPPVQAWAAWQVYEIDKGQTGQGDLAFLEEMFHSLMLSFNFWVNRKDSRGNDIFGGGFLGMDNIGVFDRDQPLPTGGTLEQSDGTSWMAKYCASMLTIAAELAEHDRIYENTAIKYFEHFLYIAHAMTNLDGKGIGLWDERDQFFYDVVHLSSGENIPLKVRSMVGLVPLFAVHTATPQTVAQLAQFAARLEWFAQERPNLVRLVSNPQVPGKAGTRLLAILQGARLEAVLRRMLDPDGFLSDHGVRSVSRYHLEHPYVIEAGGQTFEVKYLPAESDNNLFGGNSNWRGPVWFPVNYLLISALRRFDEYYGDGLKVECPTGSGRMLTLGGVAAELARRLIKIYVRDPRDGGRRAVFGGNELFQTDPHWRDYLPFHEYFNGDTAAGLGASHQTGWTALVASLLMDYGGNDSSAA